MQHGQGTLNRVASGPFASSAEVQKTENPSKIPYKNNQENDDSDEKMLILQQHNQHLHLINSNNKTQSSYYNNHNDKSFLFCVQSVDSSLFTFLFLLLITNSLLKLTKRISHLTTRKSVPIIISSTKNQNQKNENEVRKKYQNASRPSRQYN